MLSKLIWMLAITLPCFLTSLAYADYEPQVGDYSIYHVVPDGIWRPEELHRYVIDQYDAKTDEFRVSQYVSSLGETIETLKGSKVFARAALKSMYLDKFAFEEACGSGKLESVEFDHNEFGMLGQIEICTGYNYSSGVTFLSYGLGTLSLNEGYIRKNIRTPYPHHYYLERLVYFEFGKREYNPL